MYRRLSVAFAAALLALAIGASSAFAWHGELTCTTFHYVGAPVHLTWWQNGKQYNQSQVSGPWEGTISVPRPPGYGKVTVVATFDASDSPYSRTTVVPCGTPPPPPPPPPPPKPPVPPPAPPAPPVPPPAPPVPPHVTPPPPKAPCVPYPRSRYRLTERPSMRTVDHGPVTFRVRGPHIHWVHFHIDQRYTHKDDTAPFLMPTLLWRADQWGPMPRPLYGLHKVTAVIRTKCRTLHLVKIVFNSDPLPA